MSDHRSEQGGNSNPRIVLPAVVEGLERYVTAAGLPEAYYTSPHTFVFEGSERPAADALQALLSQASQNLGVSLNKRHSSVVSVLDFVTADDGSFREWSAVAFSTDGLNGMEAELLWGGSIRRANAGLEALGASFRIVSAFDAPTQP
jgi:hypothetical protein